MLPSLCMWLGVRQQAVTRLGGAVALPHLNGGFVVVQELVQLLFQLDGQGIAAGEHALQAAEVSALHIRQTEQRLIQGGNARDEVAALLDQISLA